MLDFVRTALALNRRNDIERVDVTDDCVRLWKSKCSVDLPRCYRDDDEVERRHLLLEIGDALRELDEKVRVEWAAVEDRRAAQRFVDRVFGDGYPQSTLIAPSEAVVAEPSGPSRPPWARDLDLD
jgi:hypothetical protein